jgi:DNA invertase Pin-like site-specific DNA recombinase
MQWDREVIDMLDAKHKGSYNRAMNKLDRVARSQILHLLCEGNSIRAVTRLTGASKNTVIKLMREAGIACLEYHDKSRSRKSVQGAKWNFCLTAGTLWPANREIP